MDTVNNKISSTQIKMLLFIEIFSTTSLLLPRIMIKTAGTLGWVPILLGAVGILLYSLLLERIANKIEKGFIEFTSALLGKFIGILVAIVFVTKLFFAGVFSAMFFSKILNISLLPLTPSWVIILCMLILCSWCACKGLEVRARLAEILFWLIIIPIVVIILLTIPELKLDQIVKESNAGISEMIKGSYITFTVLSAIELLLFTAPYAQKKTKNRNVITQAMVLVFGMSIALYIATVGLFGVEGSLRLEEPVLNIMQAAKLPGALIERMDALMIAFWILSIFAIISAYIFHLSTITKEVLRSGKQELICIFYGVIIFGATFLFQDFDGVNKLFSNYMIYFGMPVTVFIMIVIGVVLVIKGDEKCNK